MGLERQVLHAAQSVLQSLAVQSHSASCLTRIYSALRRLFASLSTAFASLHETLAQVRDGSARFQRSVAVSADIDDDDDKQLPPPPSAQTRRAQLRSKASHSKPKQQEEEEMVRASLLSAYCFGRHQCHPFCRLNYELQIKLFFISVI